MSQRSNNTLHKSTVASRLKQSNRSGSSSVPFSSSSSSSSSSSAAAASSSLIKTRANLARSIAGQAKATTTTRMTKTSPPKPQLKSMQYKNKLQQTESKTRAMEIELPVRIDYDIHGESIELTMKVDQGQQTALAWESVKPVTLELEPLPPRTSSGHGSLSSAHSKSLASLAEIKEECNEFQKYISEYNLDYLNADPPDNEECAADNTDYGLLLQTLFRSMSIRYDESQLSSIGDKSKSVSNIYNPTSSSKAPSTTTTNNDQSQTSKGTKRKRQPRKSSQNQIQVYNPFKVGSNLRTFDSMPNIENSVCAEESAPSTGYYRVEIPDSTVDDAYTVQSVTTGSGQDVQEISSVQDMSHMLASSSEKSTPNTKSAVAIFGKPEDSLEMLTPMLSSVGPSFKCHRQHRLRLSAHAHRSHRKHRTKRLRLSSAGLHCSRKLSTSTANTTTTVGVTSTTSKTNSSSSNSSSASSTRFLSQQLDTLGRHLRRLSLRAEDLPGTADKPRLSSTTTSTRSSTKSSSLRSKSIGSKAPTSSKQLNRSVSEDQTFRDRFQSLLRHPSFLHPKSVDLPFTLGGHRPEHLVQEIYEHRTGVNCLEMSEDRSLIVSGGEDGVLRLWSTFSTPCECISILVGHLDYITCCAIYKYLVISGSADTTLKIWSIADGNCLKTLKGHSAFVNRCMCFGPLLLSSSFDCTARIWSLAEVLTLQHFESDRQSVAINFDDDDDDDDDFEETGKTFSLTDNDLRAGEVELKKLQRRKAPCQADIVTERQLKLEFGECLHVLEGHVKSVTQVNAVSHDPDDRIERGVIHELNNIVITASADGTARTWSLATGELRHQLVGHSGPINCLAVDPKDPQIAYTAGSDHEIKCWNIITGELLRNLVGHQGAVLCLLAYNRILYSGSSDGTARAWAMEFGQNTRIYYGSHSSVTVIQYADGILYTGSNDNSVRLYDANSAVLKHTFTGHSNSISALRVVPGLLFTTSFDGRILVWDCGELLKTGKDEDDEVDGHQRSSRKQLLAGKSSVIGHSVVNTLGYFHHQMFLGNLPEVQRDRLKELYQLYPRLDHRLSLAEIEHDQALQGVFRHVFKHRSWSDFESNNQKRNSFSFRSLFSVNNGVEHLHKLWRLSTHWVGGNKAPTKARSKPSTSFAISSALLAGPSSRSSKNIRELDADQVDERHQEDSETVRRAIASLEPYIRTFH